MRQTKKTPTPPTATERDGLARTYSYTLEGTIVSLTSAALKQIAIHRRDADSASRHERRRMAAILRDDKLQARINKAIQRQLDRVAHVAKFAGLGFAELHTTGHLSVVDIEAGNDAFG